MKKKCLIIDSMHESLFPMLSEIGWDFDYRPAILRDEIVRIIGDYDGLIVRSKTTIDRQLIGENPKLKFVGRAGAGIDNVDSAYLTQKKIQVVHAAEGNRDAVGEFAIGILISLLRHIPRSNEQVRMGVWEREGNRGEELMGKTVSIIGYGNMGQAFAKRLAGFGCKVLAYDKYKSGFGNAFCSEVSMRDVFENTDILSLHIPLTEETRFMINRDYMSLFKKNIVLVNTARGEIIKLIDLAFGIESGKIRGAAIDVLENERITQLSPEQQQSFNYLKSKSNVIFSPHIAGWTFESHIKINVALVTKIRGLNL